VADRDKGLGVVESELRALSRELDMPPASDITAAVLQRLDEQAVRRRRVPDLRAGLRKPRLGWRAALLALAAVLALLIATPQGRAVVIHVLRFAGIEVRQQPGPPLTPGNSASLPSQRQTSLERARHQVAFPILVPAALGRPSEVVVSDQGRVVSLIYPQTRYGLVRMDEFAGRLDQIYFEKYVHFANVIEVQVNGARGLWIKGPHELLYITRNGTPAAASARLTTGNTLIWGTRLVALRLEGNLSKTTAVLIASSAH
jgi:hypothetical protein